MESSETKLVSYVQFCENNFYEKTEYLSYDKASEKYINHYYSYLKELYTTFNRDLESQGLEINRIPFLDFCLFIFDNSKKILDKNL